MKEAWTFTSDNIASEQAKGVEDYFLHPTDSPNSHPRRRGPVQAPFIQCSMQGSLYVGVYCPQRRVLSLINPAPCSTQSQHYSCQQMLLSDERPLDAAQIPQEGYEQVYSPASASTVSRAGQQHPMVAAHREGCRTLQGCSGRGSRGKACMCSDTVWGTPPVMYTLLLKNR